MYIITPKRMVPKRSYSYYNITCMGTYINNTKIFVSILIIPFVGIDIPSTHMTWLLLTLVQEIISIFVSELTFMSGFGNLEICSYGF